MDPTSWHSERMVIASWHVFVFITWSAYSAYLVTSFVARPQELTMRSLKDVDDNKNFKVGTMRSLSASMHVMQTSDDVHMKAVWERMEKLHQSEPLTFSTSSSVHAERVLAGDYAYIGGVVMLFNEQHGKILSNYTDIRYYPAMDLKTLYIGCVGIPTDAFYKATLMTFLDSLTENGALERLKYTYLNAESSKLLDSRKFNDEQKSVTIKRIGFVLYLTLGCMFLSSVCLGLEHVFQRWMT